MIIYINFSLYKVLAHNLFIVVNNDYVIIIITN